jgi:hypothetical protein
MMISVTRNAYFDQVADPAEKQCAERPDDEPDRKRRQVSDQREHVVPGGIEERRNHARQASEDIEVVPLDHRADR